MPPWVGTEKNFFAKGNEGGRIRKGQDSQGRERDARREKVVRLEVRRGQKEKRVEGGLGAIGQVVRVKGKD